jgi:hypothetical protein
MNIHRSHLTRADAERLLDGRAGGGDARLSALLSAARTPLDADVPGLDVAVRHFHGTHLGPGRPRRRSAMLKAALANLAAAKVALAAAAAAAATGGVALVAATVHDSGSGPAAAGAKPATSQSRPAEPSESAVEPSDSAEPSGKPSGAGTPSPSLVGLCHAVQAGATSNPGKALENPAFSVLVAAAGGKSNLAAYCAHLIGPAHTHGAPSHHPGRSSHPGGAPGSHPGPSSHPTGPPGTH